MAAHSLTQNCPPRRVVITGLGVIAPNGNDLATFWNSIRQGISAAGPVRRFDATHLPIRIAAEVKDFDPTAYMDAKCARRMDLCTRYSVAAAAAATRDAGLQFGDLDPDRVGIVEGTTVSGMESIFRGQQTYLDSGYRALSPFTIVNAYCGEGSSQIGRILGIHGYAVTYCSGCASGTDAVGYGAHMIREDEVDVVLAGAADDTMAEPMFAGFCRLKLMTNRGGNPQAAMRPFARDRDGFVLGEGAGFLVLEELSHALLRGARIYAEVLGHGRSCEAYHSTGTHPDGIGFRRCMEKALRKSRLLPEEVDYINAHGTATPTNDPIETKAIERVFGSHVERLAVSSTKPITGHMMGAAGAIESAVCALSLHKQEIPPTINLSEPDPECRLDYVPNRSRPYPLRVAVNLSAGFGGKNACVIMKSYEGAA